MADTQKPVNTVFVDLGGGLMNIYVEMRVDELKTKLAAGDWVFGDSEIGEIHFTKDVVKYIQTGKRELHKAAANRPSNLPL